jgi:hypothetical protein
MLRGNDRGRPARVENSAARSRVEKTEGGGGGGGQSREVPASERSWARPSSFNTPCSTCVSRSLLRRFSAQCAEGSPFFIFRGRRIARSRASARGRGRKRGRTSAARPGSGRGGTATRDAAASLLAPFRYCAIHSIVRGGARPQTPPRARGESTPLACGRSATGLGIARDRARAPLSALRTQKEDDRILPCCVATARRPSRSTPLRSSSATHAC